MAKYLISFPSAAMVVPDGEWEAVGRDAHAVIDEAKAAGVYVFGGGIDEAVPPQADTRGRLRSMAASRCSNYPLAKRLSRGPRASRRPAAATKSYECSGSIPLLKVDGTSISSSRGTAEQCSGANAG